MNTNIKNVLNVTWKAGLGLVGAAAAIICTIIAVSYCDEHYGRNEWADRTLSTNVVVRSYSNNTVRIWNKATGRYTTPKIRWVSGSPCKGDSLTVFCDKHGKRGYVNIKTGEIVIPAQYSKAWNFSEGVGAVLGGDNSIGFINADNQLIIDYTIPFEMNSDYVFMDGYCKARRYFDDEVHYALYRKDGSLALDWSHTRIDYPDKNGYRIIGDKNGFRLIDGNLNNVFPDIYDAISFADGNEGVYVTRNHIKQLLSFDGRVIEPFIVDYVRRLKYDINNETGEEQMEDEDIMVYLVDNWEGLMDSRTGKIITPACYWSISMVSKDLLLAQPGYNRESFVLDKKGNVIINK